MSSRLATSGCANPAEFQHLHGNPANAEPQPCLSPETSQIFAPALRTWRDLGCLKNPMEGGLL